MTRYLQHHRQKHHILKQKAWWKMISSIYNFLRASTALAHALDQRCRHPNMNNHHFLKKSTVTNDQSTNESAKEEYSTSVTPVQSEENTKCITPILSKECCQCISPALSEGDGKCITPNLSEKNSCVLCGERSKSETLVVSVTSAASAGILINATPVLSEKNVKFNEVDTICVTPTLSEDKVEVTPPPPILSKENSDFLTPLLSKEHSKCILVPDEETNCTKESPARNTQSTEEDKVLSATNSIDRPNTIEILEQELGSVHKIETNIEKQLEMQLESIYTTMANYKTAAKDFIALSEVNTDNAVAISNLDQLTKNIECETVENFSLASDFSLCTSLNSQNSNSFIKLVKEKALAKQFKTSEESCNSKVFVSINCNTPQEFPVSETEIKPEKCDSNRSIVTWLTACTPYTKQASLNLVNNFVKCENVKAVPIKRFNGLLKTQINKTVDKAKSKLVEETGKNVPKKLENLRQDLIQALADKKNIRSQVVKAVNSLEKKTGINEQMVNKPKPMVKEAVKVLPKKKSVEKKGKELLMQATSSSTKGKCNPQPKKQMVVKASKEIPISKEMKKVVQKMKLPKRVSCSVEPFVTEFKIINTASNMIKKNVVASKNQVGRKSIPRNIEKIRTCPDSKPQSRQKSGSKAKRSVELNQSKRKLVNL